ncbi:MAG: sigma 54-interacting transcriptional regulator [Deltaproteobacteria bacterium]
MTRYLMVRGRATSLRMAMPPLETLTLGRAIANDIVIAEAGVADNHLEIYLDHGVGIRVNDADTARLLGDQESALPVGKTVDLEDGDRIRVGSVEVSFATVEDEARAAAPHVVTRRYLERCIEERDGAVARLRVTGAGSNLADTVTEHARPELVIAPLGAQQVGVFVPNATERHARDVLGPIVDHLYGLGAEVLIGVAHTDEGRRDKLLQIAETRTTRPSHTTPDKKKELITLDPAMRRVVELVDRVAASTTPVLILGETGVGKDLVAQIIHDKSDRAHGPFVRTSCVDLSDAFVEEASTNFLARAKGGTVHLDELAGLSARAQLSLGYLLDDAYGAALDVRVIASSNQDLAANVKKGTFRKDLYFRLNQITIDVPPLRDRAADIVPLAERFIAEAARGRATTPQLTDNAKSKLLGHRWPGNVRELKNAIERAVLLCTGETLEVDFFGAQIADAKTNPTAAPPLQEGERLSLKDEIAALEKRRILEALERYPTQRDAAAALEMPMRTFLNRLDAFGIPRARGGGGKK